MEHWKFSKADRSEHNCHKRNITHFSFLVLTVSLIFKRVIYLFNVYSQSPEGNFWRLSASSPPLLEGDWGNALRYPLQGCPAESEESEEDLQLQNKVTSELMPKDVLQLFNFNKGKESRKGYINLIIQHLWSLSISCTKYCGGCQGYKTK